MSNKDQNKSVTQKAQEYFESIDKSKQQRSNEEIERDNQKAQEFLNELQNKINTLNNDS